MPDWKDDLANLLADVATSGAGQAVGDVAQSGVANAAFTVMDLPLNAVKTGTGATIGLMNEGLGLLPGQPGYEPGTSAAWHQGGAMGAWNEVRADEPLWFQGITELGLDPTTWTGGGGIAKGASALRAAQTAQQAAGRVGVARGLGGIARGAEGVAAVKDLPANYLLPKTQSGITRFANNYRSADGMGTGLLDLSPTSQHKVEMNGLYNAFSNARASGVQAPLAPQQAGLPGFLGGQQSLFPATPPSQRFPLTNTAIFQHPGLTLEENSLMARPLKDGTTYGQFLDEHSITATHDAAALRADGVDWDADKSKLDDWLAAIKGTPNEAANEKIVRQWHKAGIDILNADSGDDVALHLLDTRLQKEKGLRESGRSYAMSLLRSAWGEQALFSGRYQTGNISSNILMSMVSGNMDWSQVNPSTFIRNFKIYNAGANKVERNRLIAGLKSTQSSMKYGRERAPVQVFNQGGIQGLVGGEYESAIGEIATKITRSEKIGNAVGKPFVWNNRFALGVDLAPKDAIFTDVQELAMSEGLPAWEAAVKAARPGLDFATFGNPNSPPSLAAGPLMQHLESLGIRQGDATRLTRDYVELIGSAEKRGVEAMNQQQFSYLKTNLDEHVAKFVPFHYWYSRALRFWGEAAMRDPRLMLNYMRANRGIEDANADPGLSARQKGFLNLMATPLGFSLLMNPDALFGVVKVFDLNNPEDPYADPNAQWSDAPSGMTPMGGVLDWMKQRGVGLYPWMDGLLNMMGNYGNTFEPDLLGIRHRALVGSAVNFAMSQTGAEPPGTPYANAMGQARWMLSSTAANFMPGWLARPVAPKAGGSTQEASLDTIIEHIIITDQPNMTNEQLFEIMSDPESPEYTAAYDKAAKAGVVQQLLNFTLPMQFMMKNDARDVRSAQKKVFEDAAEAAGVPPFQYQPTVGDLKFAADYERLTGKPWKPGDYEDASFKVDLARAPDGEAKRFIYEDAAYHELGTPEQRAAFETFNALKFGTDPRTAGLDPAQADMMARTWLDRTNSRPAINAVYDQRESFKANHPAYAGFLKWQEDMRLVSTMYGGLSQYRQMASAQNPNAARFFDEKRAHILRTDPQNLETRMEEETISAAAYQAIIGQGQYRSQPGGIPGAPRFDTALPGMLPTAPPEQPYNPQENWMAQLARVGQSQGIWAPRR